MSKNTPIQVGSSNGMSRFCRRYLPLIVTSGAVLLSVPSARAQWVQSGTGPFAYSGTSNWVGGNVNGQFTGSFLQTGAANNAIQTVTFSSNTEIANLNFAPSIGSTYSNTAVQFQSTGGTPNTLTLDGQIRVAALDASNGSYLNIGSTTPANALNITFGSAAVIQVEGGTGNTGYLSLLNTVTGSGNLTKTGGGSLDILGATTISGAVNISDGALRVLGSSGALNTDTINVAAGSALMLLNSSTPQNGAGAAGANSSRINDTAVINLNGGWADNGITFNHVNRAAFGITSAKAYTGVYASDFGNLVVEGGTTATAINETVGSLNLQSGISRVSLRTNSATSGNITLTAGSLTRAPGTAISFAGGYGNTLNTLLFNTIGGGQGTDTSVGQTYVKFTSAPTLTGGILPYAIVAPENIAGYSSSSSANEFATYDATNGIVPFSRTGTYVTTLTAPTAADNVKLSGTTSTSTVTLAASGTINSLTIDGQATTFNLLGTGAPTLTIASGAILRNTTSTSKQVTLDSSLTLNFNNKEAFIYNSAGVMDIKSSLTNIGADGINFVSPGFNSGAAGQAIKLESAAVTSNVAVRVLAGSLSLNTSLLTNVVTVASGATLALPSSPTIAGLAGAGSVRLDGLTLTIGGTTTTMNANTTFSGNIYGAELKDATPGFAPMLTNGGNIVKSGTNSLTLSGANTYGGTTTVRGGTLIAGADASSTQLTGASKVGSATAVTSSGNTFNGNLANGTVISFVGGDTSPFTAGDVTYEGRSGATVLYYVINSTGTTFQLAATPGGTALTPNRTGYAGTGSNYQQVTALAVDATANTLTLPSVSGTVANGNIIYLNSASSNGAIPTGLASNVAYYVVNASNGGSTFQVSSTLGGPAIDITTTGTNVFAIRPGAFGSGTSAIIMGDASSGTLAKNLLTGGAYTIERSITVTGTATGGTGVTTLGGNTDDNSTFSGAIALGATTQLTSVTTGTNAVTFSGAMSGSGGITKVGTGRVIISGSNSYTGATTISAGKLSVNGYIGAGSSVTVQSGGTLGGSGTTAGTVTVQSGGHFAPGNSISTTFQTGALTLNAGASSDIELGTASNISASSVNDRVTVNGALNLGGILNLIDNVGANGNGSAGAGSYLIFTGATGVSGSFSSISNVSGYHAAVDSTSTAGNVYVKNYQIAAASALPSTVNLGITHVGKGFAGSALNVQNTSASNGYAEGLNATKGATTGDATVSGSNVSNLAGGSTSTSIKVGLDATTVGTKTGTVAVGFASNGTNSGYSDSALSSQTVTVNGQVNYYADAAFSLVNGGNLASADSTHYTLSLGSVELNTGSYTATITLNNVLHDATYQDLLGGGFDVSSKGEFTLNGFDGTLTSIVSGSNITLTVSFNTAGATEGLHSGTILFNPTSANATATESLSQISLALDVQVVPEPATWSMIVGGLGMMIFAQRARRRASH